MTELCNIRLNDVDREEKKIDIRGKGRKSRVVYYQPSLDLLMDVWLDERRPAVYYADENEYLFPTLHSENITRQTVEEAVREAADRTELQEVHGRNADGHELHTVTPHVLRHSFAMAALDKGWEIYMLSQALATPTLKQPLPPISTTTKSGRNAPSSNAAQRPTTNHNSLTES